MKCLYEYMENNHMDHTMPYFTRSVALIGKFVTYVHYKYISFYMQNNPKR